MPKPAVGCPSPRPYTAILCRRCSGRRGGVTRWLGRRGHSREQALGMFEGKAQQNCHHESTQQQAGRQGQAFRLAPPAPAHAQPTHAHPRAPPRGPSRLPPAAPHPAGAPAAAQRRAVALAPAPAAPACCCQMQRASRRRRGQTRRRRCRLRPRPVPHRVCGKQCYVESSVGQHRERTGQGRAPCPRSLTRQQNAAQQRLQGSRGWTCCCLLPNSICAPPRLLQLQGAHRLRRARARN